MAAIPPVIIGWFKTAYPTLVFNPPWLDACVDYFRQIAPANTNQQLIKAVEGQLLCSDLSTSTLQGPSYVPSPVPTESQTLYVGKKSALLLQVVSVEEIAQPALAQLRILNERRELARLKREDAEFDAEERERRRIRAEGAEEDDLGEGEWVRGMLKFVLSDGRNEIKAVEWQRINSLGLDKIKLGGKFLVSDIKLVKGILLLSPASATLKGGMIEELDVFFDVNLERRLNERLGKPNDPVQGGLGAPIAAQPAPPPGQRQRGAAVEQRNPARQDPAAPRRQADPADDDHMPEPDDDGDPDEEAEKEMMAIERAALAEEMRKSKQKKKALPAAVNKEPVKNKVKKEHAQVESEEESAATGKRSRVAPPVTQQERKPQQVLDIADSSDMEDVTLERRNPALSRGKAR